MGEPEEEPGWEAESWCLDCCARLFWFGEPYWDKEGDGSRGEDMRWWWLGGGGEKVGQGDGRWAMVQ